MAFGLLLVRVISMEQPIHVWELTAAPHCLCGGRDRVDCIPTYLIKEFKICEVYFCQKMFYSTKDT